MKYFVYVLLSEKDKKRYIGMSGNMSRRLVEHQSGQVRSTRHRRPLKLVYQEFYYSRAEALAREKFLKSGKGRKYLNDVLTTYVPG